MTLLAIPRRRQPATLQVIQSLNPDEVVTVDAMSAATASAMESNRIRK